LNKILLPKCQLKKHCKYCRLNATVRFLTKTQRLLTGLCGSSWVSSMFTSLNSTSLAHARKATTVNPGQEWFTEQQQEMAVFLKTQHGSWWKTTQFTMRPWNW